MLQKVDVRIDVAKLEEKPVLPEVLQVLKIIRPSWLPETVRHKVNFMHWTGWEHFYFDLL